MPEANVLVMRRAVILWIGSGLLLGFNIFAASQRSIPLVMWALALSAAFSLVGVAFGIWAARKVTARSTHDETLLRSPPTHARARAGAA